MMDIVFPDKNEKEFAEMAEKLGYSGLCFIYPEPKKAEDLKLDTKLEIKTGIVCKEKIKKAEIVLLKSNNRSLIKKKPNFVFGIEGKNDSMHKRDSGLDPAVCKDLAQFKVGYVVSFFEILEADDREGLIGRIMQNIRLCRKYKVQMIMASFARKPIEMRNQSDMASFARVIGIEKLSNF